MNTQETAAFIIALGSLVFGLGASMPTSSVFTEPDPEKKLRILTGAPAVWRFSQVGFGAGPTIAAVGLGLLALTLPAGAALLLGYLGAGLLLIGVVCWDRHVYLRAVDPQEFTRGLIPSWLFQVYTVLTCLGLIAFGGAFLLAGYPVWLGAAAVTVGIASLIVFVATKDMVPFVYYILLLAVALAIGPGWLGLPVLAALVATALAYLAVRSAVPQL